MVAASVGVPLVVALPAASWPVVVSLGAAGAAVVAVGAYAPFLFRRAYAWILGGLLLGYAFLGRGFAYLNIAGVHVGEVALLLGLVTLIVAGRRWRIAASPVPILILLFAAWGAARTIPYLREYGLDAARDAVVWGYAAFALVVALLVRAEDVQRWIGDGYARVLPWFLVWVPLGCGLTRAVLDQIPRVPGTDIAVLHLKSGDAAVHLAGAAAFLLLGLHKRVLRNGSQTSSISEWVMWGFWTLGVLVISNNRGGLLTLAVSLSVVLLLGRRVRWRSLLAVAGALALVMVSLNVEVTLDGAREISADHVIAALSSVVDPYGATYLGGSRDWRISWWLDIIDYTVFGEYFWTGKGFGLNLADDDGFPVGFDNSLRSPHNGHMTILARAGVPGLVLWLLLQVLYASALYGAYRRARARARTGWAGVNLWLLTYWLAFMINGSFDVYLEGPQGGIWFWCQMGFGIAFLRIQRSFDGNDMERSTASSRPKGPLELEAIAPG